MAPPAAGPRRGRLPRRRHRRARLRPVVGAAGDRGLPDAAHRRRQRRPRRRARRGARPSSSATTGARRSPGTRRCCGPTCSAPSPGCRCRSPRPATSARPTRSGRWPATRSSTSSTSRSRAGPRPRSKRTCAAGCSASTSRRPATPRAAGRQRHDGDRSPTAGRWRDRFAYPDAMPAWLTRRRPRRVRRRVRAHRLHRRRSTATATSTATGRTWRRSAAGRSRCRRCSSAATATARRSGARRAIERFPTTLPQPAPLAHPRRLRPLDPAGAPRRGQRGAARLPLRGRLKGPLVDLQRTMSEITITLPDGSEREYPAGTTAADVASSIGKRLAKAAVAATVDGEEVDLGRPLRRPRPASPSSPTTPRPAATCCATRRPTSWPRPSRSCSPAPSSRSARPSRTASTTTSSCPAGARSATTTWRRSRPGCARSSPPTSRSCAPRCRADEALEVFADQPYKVEIIERVQAGAATAPTTLDAGEVAAGGTISVYRNTPEFVDLCQGPHVPVDRPPRSLQAAEGRRRLLAGQREGPDAAAHLRHGVGVRRRPARRTSSSSPRPRSATTAGWPPSSTCSASRASSAAASPCGTPRAPSSAS